MARASLALEHVRKTRGEKGLIRAPPTIGSMRRAHRIQLVALSKGTGLSLIRHNKSRGRPSRPSTDSDYNHGSGSSSFDPMLRDEDPSASPCSGVVATEGSCIDSAPWNLRRPRNLAVASMADAPQRRARRP